MRRAVLLLLLLLYALPAGPAAAQETIGGVAPTYTQRQLSPTPLDPAIRRRHWAPGLNEGYVPQGLTLVRNTLFVGAYRSTDANTSRGPARIFAVDPAGGAVIGGFDLPAAIGHADGLAATPDGGLLYLADNGRSVYAFDLPRSLAQGRAEPVGAPRKLARDEGLGSNLLTYGAGLLWFGRYARDGSKAILVAADPGTLFAANAAPFALKDAVRRIPLPQFAQGATFDAAGRLWVSASNSRMGRLYRLDSATGAVLAEFPAMAGLEDLARGGDGLLWSIGEAGSQRWNTWATFYPLLFAFDPAALR